MDLFNEYAKQADSQVDNSGLAYTHRQSIWKKKQIDTDDTIEFKRQLALQMYQNAYNSPDEQFNRLIAAGVSPFAAAQAVSGNLDSASTASGVAGTGLAQQENDRANLMALSDLFNNSIQFAQNVVGLVDSGLTTKYNFQTFADRVSIPYHQLQGQIFQNRLLGEKTWAQGFENALRSYSMYPNSDSHYFAGQDFQISPETFSVFSPYLASQLTDSKIKDMNYHIDNILPEILKHYKLNNDQSQYIVDSLKALPPEIRNYIMLGLSIYSTFK